MISHTAFKGKREKWVLTLSFCVRRQNVTETIGNLPFKPNSWMKMTLISEEELEPATQCPQFLGHKRARVRNKRARGKMLFDDNHIISKLHFMLLVFFNLVKIPLEEVPHLRNWLHENGLLTTLVGIFLIDDQCGKTQAIICRTTPAQETLGCIRKQTEQDIGSKSVRNISSWFLRLLLFEFLPLLPSQMGGDLNV